MNYQFKIEIKFHFLEHSESRQQNFIFGDDCHRRVPVEMQGVYGLNTIGMFIDSPRIFEIGEVCEVDCIVIAPQLFKSVIKVGSTGKLWDSGFFADVIVLEIYQDGWPNDL